MRSTKAYEIYLFIPMSAIGIGATSDGWILVTITMDEKGNIIIFIYHIL